MTDPRDRKRESRERAKRDAARSDAITRERRAAEAAQPYRHAEVVRLARAEQLKAAIKRRDALKRERARVVARIQAELEAERTSAKAKELARLQRRVTQAKRREAVATADRAHAPCTRRGSHVAGDRDFGGGRVKPPPRLAFCERWPARVDAAFRRVYTGTHEQRRPLHHDRGRRYHGGLDPCGVPRR